MRSRQSRTNESQKTKFDKINEKLETNIYAIPEARSPMELSILKTSVLKEN